MFQRLSIIIQRFNGVLVHQSFIDSDEDPDRYSSSRHILIGDWIFLICIRAKFNGYYDAVFDKFCRIL